MVHNNEIHHQKALVQLNSAMLIFTHSLATGHAAYTEAYSKFKSNDLQANMLQKARAEWSECKHAAIYVLLAFIRMGTPSLEHQIWINNQWGVSGYSDEL
ncbi:hypothetical protein TNCV_3087041 [Trichonephila clavipes]|nr:hypothetical protein TNCV_3087041 [Trichonephila clavipes]